MGKRSQIQLLTYLKSPRIAIGIYFLNHLSHNTKSLGQLFLAHLITNRIRNIIHLFENYPRVIYKNNLPKYFHLRTFVFIFCVMWGHRNDYDVRKALFRTLPTQPCIHVPWCTVRDQRHSGCTQSISALWSSCPVHLLTLVVPSHL